MRRLVGSLIAVVFIAVSCGDDEARPADTDGGVEVVAASTTTAAPSTTTAAPAADAGSADETDVETVALTEVLAAPARRDGSWPLAEGRWVSEAFGEPGAFDLSGPAGLVVEGRSMLWLRIDDIVEPHGLLFVDPAVVFDSGVERPVSDSAAELDEQLRSIQGVEVLAAGEVPEVGSWWDLVLRPASPGFECGLGPRCEFVLRTEGDDLVSLPVDDVIRLYLSSAERGPSVAWVVAPEGARTELQSTAESILSSWSPTELDRTADVRFLRSVGGGGRVVPDGAWATSLGAGSVRFDVVDNVSVRLAVALDETVFLVVDEGSLMLQTAIGLVPPTFEQGDSLGALPDAETLDARGWTVETFEAWLRDLLVIIDQGSTSIGEVEFSWWDVTVDDTVVSTPCGFQRTADGRGRCVDFATRDLGWFVADTQPARIFFAPEEQLIGRLASTSLDTELSVVAAAMAPVIDRMAFEPGIADED